MIPKEEKTYFTHVNNVVTVCFSFVSLESEQTTVEYAISWCNPRDMFCRRTGRKISEGRKCYRPGVAKFSPDFVATTSAYDMANVLVDIDVDQGLAPSWVYQERIATSLLPSYVWS